MLQQLSQGSIERIMNGEEVTGPVLQVLGTKKIQGQGQAADRYRLLLSDGLFSHSSAMLATQLNDKVDTGELAQYTIIQLNKFLCNQIQGDRRVVIVLEMSMLVPGEEVGEKLGAPQPYKPGQPPSAPPPKQQPVAPAAQPQRPLQAQPQPNANVRESGNSFYGNNNQPKTPIQQRPQLSQQNSQNSPGGGRVFPISSLTPYQNRWTIQVRVTSKSDVRTWSNARGEGKLFSMVLMDESGSIRCTAFKDEVDKFYDTVEVGKIYYVSKGSLKTADKRFSNVDNDYEMTFGRDTTMLLCEDEANIPQVTYNFVALASLDSLQPNSNVDVIGVVKDTGEVTTIMGKQSQREIKKRDITIVDTSKAQVRLTMWGMSAEKFDGLNSIIAIKGCRLSDWGGRSLSCLGSSETMLNPDIQEAHHLRGWYDSEGHRETFTEYSHSGGGGQGGNFTTNWRTIEEAKAAGTAQGDGKPDYCTVKATTVMCRKENCTYKACIQPDCNKKVVDNADGTYRCEKCNTLNNDFKYRLILSVNISDFSGSTWITCFQEVAENLLGCSATDIGNMQETDDVRFDGIMKKACYQPYIFKLRSKMETYNDEARLKAVALQLDPVDHAQYNTHLLEEIDKLVAA